jgi:lipopolysaccharide/colanic/teichoic acid biosynthesis glycosyltransferase
MTLVAADSSSKAARKGSERPKDICMPDYGCQRTISLLPHPEMSQWNSGKQAPRRAFDIGCALAGLVLSAPLLAMIALAIKLDDGGPVLYCQCRIGKGLRKFRLVKFRSMYAGCGEDSLLTAPRDSRVTRVGKFLRRYKLDELPQFVNVLRGEMQLVGVRPQVARFVQIYPEEYKELLREPPGITGLASLCFRNEAEMFHEGLIEAQYIHKILPMKLQMSLNYSRTRTFRSDLEILVRTVLGLQAPSTALREAGIDPAMPSLFKFASRNSE